MCPHTVLEGASEPSRSVQYLMRYPESQSACARRASRFVNRVASSTHIRCTQVDRVLAPPSHLRAVSARGSCFWTGKAGELVSARVCAGMARKHPAMVLGLRSKHVPYALCSQRAKQGS